MFCDECTKFANQQLQLPKLVKITEKKDKYIFYVESTGVLAPADIIKMAFRELKNKLEYMYEAFESLEK